MSPLFRKRKQKTYHMALDIGSQYVKAAQFSRFSEEEPVAVWGLGLNKQQNNAMENGLIQHTGRVAQVVENTILEANHLDSYENESLMIGVSGPYVREHITTVWHRRPKSNKKIKVREWEEILENFQEQAQQNTPEFDEELGLAHSSLISMAIDETRTPQVVGQKGEKLEAQIFRTYVPQEQLDAVEEISDQVGIPLGGVVSESFASAQLLSSYYPNADFIFIDIGSSTTTVSRIEHGLIQQTTHFGIGGISFTRRIVQELEVSFVEAESIKVQYSLAQLSKKVSHRLADLLKEDIRMWLEGVQVSLDVLTESERDVLPSVILLQGGGANLIGIKEALQFDHWYEEVSFEQKPKVGVFHPDTIPVVDDQTGSASDPLYVNVLGLAHISQTFNA